MFWFSPGDGWNEYNLNSFPVGLPCTFGCCSMFYHTAEADAAKSTLFMALDGPWCPCHNPNKGNMFHANPRSTVCITLLKPNTSQQL